MSDMIETVFKLLIAILALLGGKEVITRFIVIFNKKVIHSNLSVNSSETVGRDKIVTNNHYHFPGLGDPGDPLSQTQEKKSNEIDFTESSRLTDPQEELCKRLDLWHKKYGLTTKPSNMFRGALFVSRTALRQNPDWVAQAAHSLRDILYPFGSNGAPNKAEALKQYGSVFGNDQSFIDEFGRIYGTLTELSHHGNGRGSSVDFLSFDATDFEKIIADFERIMRDALLRQLDVHDEIDAMLNGITSPEKSK